MSVRRLARWLPLPLAVATLLALGVLAGSVLARTAIYEDLNLLVEILQLVSRNYLEQVDEEVLLEGAIEGLLFSTDSEAVYFPEGVPAVSQSERAGTTEAGPGVGILLAARATDDPRNTELIIASVIPESPAERAGVRAGDRLIKLGETFVSGISVEQAYRMMQGPAGEEIAVSVYRGEGSELLDLKLARAQLTLPPRVRGRMLPDGTALMRLWRIDRQTEAEVRQRLRGWGLLGSPAPAAGEATGGEAGHAAALVLDLRGCVLGEPEVAVEMADLLVADGREMARVVSLTGAVVERFEARDGERLRPGVPVAVLVDGSTAGPAEILAAIVRETNGQVSPVELLGSKTFGRALKRSRVDLTSGGVLLLATGEFRTAEGRVVHGQGLEPDGGLAPEAVARAAKGHGGAPAPGSEAEPAGKPPAAGEPVAGASGGEEGSDPLVALARQRLEQVRTGSAGDER